MKKLILLLFIPIFSFSQIQKKEMNQNPMIKKKMQMKMNKKFESNSFRIKKKIEKEIIDTIKKINE